MTEREKMYAGMVYDPFAEGMPEDRTRAHVLCKQYNDTTEVDAERREEILRELMPDRGADVYLQGPIYFDFGYNISMGKGSFANFNFTVMDEAKVTIGESVFIGPSVNLVTAVHPLRWQERNAFFNKKTGNVTNLERALPITIGDNCWIGAGVTICPGVTIGSGCVIGAGSVVTRDIPDNTIAVGNPCKPLRPISNEDSFSSRPDWPNDLF